MTALYEKEIQIQQQKGKNIFSELKTKYKKLL